MVTGRESQLTVFRPPSSLWRLWMDLASLLLLWCWGHHQGVRAATPRCGRCGRRTWWGDLYLSVLPPRPGRYRLYGYPWTTYKGRRRPQGVGCPSESPKRAWTSSVRVSRCVHLHNTRCRSSNQLTVQQSKRTKGCSSKELPVFFRGPRLIHTVCKPLHSGMRAGPQLGPQERAAQKIRGGRRSKEKCKGERGKGNLPVPIYVLIPSRGSSVATCPCTWTSAICCCTGSLLATWTMSELPLYVAGQMSQTYLIGTSDSRARGRRVSAGVQIR